jgi:hypothetical protein
MREGHLLKCTWPKEEIHLDDTPAIQPCGLPKAKKYKSRKEHKNYKTLPKKNAKRTQGDLAVASERKTFIGELPKLSSNFALARA